MLRLCLAVQLFGLFLLDCEENAIAVCIVPFINLMIFYIHIVRQVIMYRYIQNNVSCRATYSRLILVP